MSVNRKRARRRRRLDKKKAKKRAFEALLRRGEKHFDIARCAALRQAVKGVSFDWVNSWKIAADADRVIRLVDYAKGDAEATSQFIYRHYYVGKNHPQPVPGKVELGTICLKPQENESTAEQAERP